MLANPYYTMIPRVSGAWCLNIKIEARRRIVEEKSAKRIGNTLDAGGGGISRRAHPDLDKARGFGSDPASMGLSRHPTLDGRAVKHHSRGCGRYTAILYYRGKHAEMQCYTSGTIYCSWFAAGLPIAILTAHSRITVPPTLDEPSLRLIMNCAQKRECS